MIRHSKKGGIGIRAIDLFCGAGGSSWGAREAGVEIAAGFDRWKKAGQAYTENFPDATFYEGDLEDRDPKRIRATIGSIDLLIASPECTNHSPAKGASPRCEKSKETAFQVLRYARVFQPRWIVIENVVSMRKWGRYIEFVDELRKLGYNVEAQVLDASKFGVPQTRRRLFLLCDRDSPPKSICPSKSKPVPVANILEQASKYRLTPLRQPRRADATLARADRAIESVGKKSPFLIVYYGSDHAGGWQPLDRPLRTITTLDRFAYVTIKRSEHFMRMLQVPELKAAMGMPSSFSLGASTRRDSIKMIGNGVCPPVMRAVIETLTR